MKSFVVLLPVLVALQAGVEPALAWAWPVDGPVLRPFVLGDDPYAGGQHRGIDIGATPGEPVQAPAAGDVTFAGIVPTGGKTLTIRTGDGYAVTLLHLGAYSVARGEAVVEGDVVGAAGASGAPAEPTPYVYLGIRRADDPNGYVDPLSLLPAPAAAPEDPAEPPPAEPAAGAAPVGVESASPDASASPQPAGSHSRATHGEGAEERSSVPAEGSAGVPGRGRLDRGTDVARGRGRRARPLHGDVRLGHVRSDTGPGLTLRRAAATRVPARAPSAGERAASLPAVALLAGAIGAAAAGLAAAGLGAISARRRRELRDAAAADSPPAVLAKRISPAAEHADGLRLGEEDGVVLDRDLERVLLAQREALSDLDRDHDPAEVVDVADDPRARRSSGRTGRRVPLPCRSGSHRSSQFGCGGISGNTSPAFSIPNHRFRPREREARFV
ncbi:MAG TPA: M23 family metallopeptidase [Gaiellaceae bacterium]|nr:M23 family metallopeptidase [Gaiellaceae bacterium]